ncbi:hypothetical protein QEN19_001805 [Hanseniaspora menglaensis]
MNSVDEDSVFVELSRVLEKNPLKLNNWERLINHLLENYYKNEKLSIGERKDVLPLLRTTYKAMLLIFPYLENYVIEYGNMEFIEGNYKQFHLVYKEGLKKINNRSLLLWVSYLKMIIEEQVCLKLENKFILHKLREAEGYIGRHFHSQSFWTIYLLFLKKTCISNPKLYFDKLKDILKIINYDFAYNFRILFKELDSVNDMKQLKMFYDIKRIEPPKLLKPREKLELLKYKIKKVYKEEYKKIEKKVMILYNNYELPLTLYKQSNLYYTSPKIPLSPKFVQIWLTYISYAISTKDKYYIMLIFQRALLSSSIAHSKVIWMEYIKWLISCNDRVSAKEILNQSSLFIVSKKFIKK